MKGVNSKVDLVNLERQYLREKAEELLESGTLIRDPSKTDIRGQSALVATLKSILTACL